MKTTFSAWMICCALVPSVALRAQDENPPADNAPDEAKETPTAAAEGDAKTLHGIRQRIRQKPEPEHKSFWTQKEITGDWWGARTAMGEKGVSLELRLTQYYQGVVNGGIDQRGRYSGKVDYVLDIDGHKLGLWEGFFFNMHVETQWGDIVDDAGAFTFPNTHMLWPLPNYGGTAITGVLFEQALSKNFVLVAGKINVLDLYTMIVPQAGYGVEGFMNMNVLAPALPWLRWVNLSVMGGGALVLTDDLQIRAGVVVFDTQNSSTTTGFNDMFSNGAGILGLYRFFIEMDKKPGSVTFVFGGSTGSYDSLAPTDWGWIPGVGLVGEERTGTWTGAILYEQLLWADPGQQVDQLIPGSKGRNVRLLTGWSVSDGDPSFSKFGGFGSVEATGMLFGRKGDRAGIGAYYTELGTDFRNLLTIAGGDPKNMWGAELYYNVEVTPWFHLTGDVQVVQGAQGQFDPALILGLRAVLDF
jgi:porin